MGELRRTHEAPTDLMDRTAAREGQPSVELVAQVLQDVRHTFLSRGGGPAHSAQCTVQGSSRIQEKDGTGRGAT